MEKIIFATGNKNKVRELRGILADFPVDIISMKEAGIDAHVIENGSTFEENAVIKAETVRDIAGCIVLADDSGLEVDYLGGAPGIYSARFLGEETPYSIKNAEIIRRLEGVPDGERTTRFVCAAEGIIGYREAGWNGFGYDPIFFLPERGMTTAQLSADEKNAISHRGKALRAIREVIGDYLRRHKE